MPDPIRPSAAALLLLVALSACEGGTLIAPPNPPPPPPPPPAGTLALVARTPAAGAVDQPYATLVTATFDSALNPASVNAVSFAATLAGGAIPASAFGAVGSPVATLLGPFLPNSEYTITAGSDLRTPGNSALASPQSWTFRTRATATAVADRIGRVGARPALAVDSLGALHVSYFDSTASALKYATCAANCLTEANWRAVTIEAGNVGFTSALVVQGGRVSIAYYAEAARQVKLATCALACTQPNAFVVGVVDPGPQQRLGPSLSLVAEPTGRLHLVYADQAINLAYYVTCPSTCAQTASWSRPDLLDSRVTAGQLNTLQVDRTGRLHAVYTDPTAGNALRLATCPTATANCTITGNWFRSAIPNTAGAGRPAFVLDTLNRLHVAFARAGDQAVVYTRCLTACDQAASWLLTTLDPLGRPGARVELQVDPQLDRVHLLYADAAQGRLRYATCVRECLQPARWVAATFNQLVLATDNLALALGRDAQPRVVAFDPQLAVLRYAE